MLIDHKIIRNSGATLEPCIYKRGPGVREQGLKMQQHYGIFAPITEILEDGYLMPVLQEARPIDLSFALERLVLLWSQHTGPTPASATSRGLHHVHQVAPYAGAHTALQNALVTWWERTRGTEGHVVQAVHGDPTIENHMYGGVWLDPSIRSMPMEAELDGGKLLQSYFGYGGKLSYAALTSIKSFLQAQNLNIDLCVYYMVTHVVRLYRIQTHARPWALDLLSNLEEKVEELKCK